MLLTLADVGVGVNLIVDRCGLMLIVCVCSCCHTEGLDGDVHDVQYMQEKCRNEVSEELTCHSFHKSTGDFRTVKAHHPQDRFTPQTHPKAKLLKDSMSHRSSPIIND